MRRCVVADEDVPNPALYEECKDPECPYDYAYRLDGTKAPHYHYIGPTQPDG
jgi:hypothetical protein